MSILPVVLNQLLALKRILFFLFCAKLFNHSFVGFSGYQKTILNYIFKSGVLLSGFGLFVLHTFYAFIEIKQSNIGCHASFQNHVIQFICTGH